MAKAKQTIVRTRTKKTGKGYKTCPKCNGSGKVKK